MTYPTIFHLLASEFPASDIRCIVIGGFAVNYHGVTRQTADCDFMIVDSDYKVAKRLLEQHGYREVDARDAFARLAGPSPFLMDVDFMFVDANTFDQIWNEGINATIADCDFRLPSLDHLFALKFHAMKHSPGRHNQKDLLDTPLPTAKHLTMDEYVRFVHMQRQYRFEKSPDARQPPQERQHERFRL